MNNIRKIIAERLENARNDYQKCFEEIDYPLCKSDILCGQIEAYQDCLNLIHAPRTEQEILNDFEKLGYEVVCNSDYELELDKENKVQGGKYIIHIDKEFKLFTKLTCFDYRNHLMLVTMQEHKLLNELFTIWGWL